MEQLKPSENQEGNAEKAPDEYTFTHRLEGEKYIFELHINKALKIRERRSWYYAWNDALDKLAEKYQLGFNAKGNGDYAYCEFQINTSEVNDIEHFYQELETEAIDIFTSPRKPHLFG